MSTTQNTQIPDEFINIIKEFVIDIDFAFPEIQPTLQTWWKTPNSFMDLKKQDRNDAFTKSREDSIEMLFTFCKTKYLSNFSSILQKDETIFGKDKLDDKSDFLPQIYFSELWNMERTTDATKNTIWKYMQMILLSVFKSCDTLNSLGDTSSFKENNEMKQQFESLVNNFGNIFNGIDSTESNSDSELDSDSDSDSDLDGFNTDEEDKDKDKGQNTKRKKKTFAMPNADELAAHMESLMETKIGKLANEIMLRTANKLGMNDENADIEKIFSELVKQPTMAMDIMQDAKETLEHAVTSGEITNKEMMDELTGIMEKVTNIPGFDPSQLNGLMKKMKHMPGMDILLKQMGLGGNGAGGGGGPLSPKEMAKSEAKQKMRYKMEQRRKAREERDTRKSQPVQSAPNAIPDDELIRIFSTGEKAIKTPRKEPMEKVTKNKKNKKS
jgi:hypothetical protein